MAGVLGKYAEELFAKSFAYKGAHALLQDAPIVNTFRLSTAPFEVDYTREIVSGVVKDYGVIQDTSSPLDNEVVYAVYYINTTAVEQHITQIGLYRSMSRRDANNTYNWYSTNGFRGWSNIYEYGQVQVMTANSVGGWTINAGQIKTTSNAYHMADSNEDNETWFEDSINYGFITYDFGSTGYGVPINEILLYQTRADLTVQNIRIKGSNKSTPNINLNSDWQEIIAFPNYNYLKDIYHYLKFENDLSYRWYMVRFEFVAPTSNLSVKKFNMFHTKLFGKVDIDRVLKPGQSLYETIKLKLS